MKELEVQIKYLCNPKMKCLIKGDAKKPKITPNEKISINDNFKSPLLKANFIPKKTHKKRKVAERSEMEI